MKRSGRVTFSSVTAFPQRDGRVAARRHDAVALHAQAAGERRERRRRPLVDPLEQQRMIREERQRPIVERGEAEAQQRGGAVGDDRGDQLARRHRAMEDRGAPEIRGQRHRHELARTRVDRRPTARRRLARGVQVRVGRRPPPFGRVVEKPRDLVDEPAAVGRRIDPERLRERDGATGDRHVLGNGGCGGWMKLKYRYNRGAQQAQQRGLQKAHIIYMASANYTAKDITVLEGLEPVRKRPGMYRGRRLSRPPSSRLGNARQLRRRGDERLRFKHLGHASRRWIVDHDRRRWPRHSDRQASDVEEERARSDLHRPPRRRQVRARQLQDRRRPARRRRQRRQRAVEGARRDRQARRRAVGDALQAGQAGQPAEEDRPRARHRHHGLLPPRRRDLPEDRVRPGDHQGAARGRQLPAQGAEGHLRRRRGEREARLRAQRRDRRLPEEDRRRARRQAGARRAVHAHERRGAAARSRAAVDGSDRRARAVVRQRHPHRLRAARTKAACAPASARRCATSSRRTTCRRRA